MSAEAVVLRLSPALHVYHVSNGQARRRMGICRRRPLTRLSGACRHEQARICLLVAGIKIPAAASSSPPPSRRNYLISVKFVYFQELFLIAAAELLAVSCSSALCVMSGCCCNFVSHVCQGLYLALFEQIGDLLRATWTCTAAVGESHLRLAIACVGQMHAFQ